MNPSFPAAPPPPPPQGGSPGPAPPSPFAYPPHAGPPAPPGAAAATASLPRGSVLLPALVLLGIGFFAFFLPIVLLAAGESMPSPNRIYEHFREGGLGMWLITLAQIAALLGVTVAGILRIRGARVPGAVLFGLPLLPFGIGALAAIWSEGKMMGAISGASIDPSFRARIMAEGVSELSNLFVYGGAASGTAMYLASVAATLSILSVDTSRVAPGPGNMAWLGGVGGAFVAFLAAAGVRLGLKMRWTGLDALVILGLFSAGMLAALGGRKARFLVAAKQEDEASRAFRMLVLAGLALAAALLFLDRASLAASVRLPLGAIAGESVDPSQRATILAAEVIQARSGIPTLMAVDVIGCLLAFGAPVAAAAGVARRFSISAIVAAAAGALTFLLAIAAGARIDSDLRSLREPYIKVEQAIVAAGITLAPVPGADEADSPSLEQLVLVKKDGSVDVQSAPAASGPSAPVELDDEEMRSAGPVADVAADAALPLEKLVSSAMPSLQGGRADRVFLITASPWQRSLDELGPFAGLVGTSLPAYRVSLQPRLARWVDPDRNHRAAGYAAGVLPGGDSARLVIVMNGSPPQVMNRLDRTLPLGTSFQASEERRETLTWLTKHLGAGAVVLAPPAGETTGKVLEWISLIRASSSSEMQIVLTPDRAALEQAPTPAPSQDPAPAPTQQAPKQQAPRQQAPKQATAHAGSGKKR
jgi:hypothetical protein